MMMRVLHQIAAAAGAPIGLAEIRDVNGHHLTLCNWRHRDTRVTVRSSDALRVVMNLRGTYAGRHDGGGKSLSISGTPGAMALFAPGTSCDTMGEGELDMFEVYLPASEADTPDQGSEQLPPLAVQDEALRAAMVQTFVAAGANDRLNAWRAATTLRRFAWTALRSHATSGGIHFHKSGLAPSSRNRVERLLNQSTARGVPRVKALAAEAGLSVNHFIRSWRHETGGTPHQQIMDRRALQALGLLGDSSLSVSEIADLTGFSSPSHFIASFRHRYGVTPGRYRYAVMRHEALSGKHVRHHRCGHVPN